MTKTLIDAYNYFENHKEYGYVDIPEEDLVTIINLHNVIVDAMSQLKKDGRIVSAICNYPTHDGKGSIQVDKRKGD
jgi:hypothetical protein